MKNFISTLFLVTVIINEIHGDPFMFLPEDMLPPIGTTFNFTFDGALGALQVSGIYTIQPVIDHDMKTIIGYRNWQSYTGQFNGTFYGVSYKNGTYPQALINPNTQECENVFSETVNCTGWSNTAIIRWDNRCSIVRTDSPVTGDMSLTLYASKSDSKRPVNFIGITSISGTPVNMTVIYNFLFKTEQKNFPYIKCSF
jgi:hypothetical protein